MPSSRGQHEVEQHELERIAQPGLDAHHAVPHRGDLVPVPGQQIDDAVAQAGFVFDHEDPHAIDCAIGPCKADVRTER